MNSKFILLETSQKVGLVGLAEDGILLAEDRLETPRHQARDLAPTLKRLLDKYGWKARDLEAIIVGIGPGSYTGLRVGIMSAKTLAYATGCKLIGVPTFSVLAYQVQGATDFDIIADAQQNLVYCQRFYLEGTDAAPLAIRPFDEWLASLPPNAWVSGPGLELYRDKLRADVQCPEPHHWYPRLANLLQCGFNRVFVDKRFDDPFTLEPIYLRPSSAELNWKGK